MIAIGRPEKGNDNKNKHKSKSRDKNSGDKDGEPNKSYRALEKRFKMLDGVERILIVVRKKVSSPMTYRPLSVWSLRRWSFVLTTCSYYN